MVKLIKAYCEIEGCKITDRCALHFHHIIERTEINTTNNISNIAILCAVHHEYVHSGKLKIICVIPSTKSPNNRTLLYELDGKKNIDLDINPIKQENKSYKIFWNKDNEDN